MKPRQPSDPWFTILYRDPHTVWWAPAVAVAVVVALVDLLVFDLSVRHSLAVAALIGGSSAAGSYVRWRRRRNEVP